jgi:hypothetical protein|tara:strand:+ start:224 stop:652 length:429 start_codon:yes stop_codon:yes gene_type:complete
MVKIIRLVSGEEICCIIPKEQVKDKSHLLRLSEPMLIKYVPQITEVGISDYIALVKWVGFTNDKIITIPKDKIMTIANATEPFTRRYHHLVDSLSGQTQKLPSFIERDLSEEDYDEFDKQSKKKDKLEDLKKFFDMPSKKIH